MKISKMGLIIIAGFLILIVGCGPCQPPQITSISPQSGPGGTIAEVEYSGGGLTGTIIFAGTQVKTHNAYSLGIGNKLRFTIPYNATAGNKNVQVKSKGGTSPAVTFNVTGPGTIPTPALESFAIGSSDGSEMTVFGTGFSTLSRVYIDGIEVISYIARSLPNREIPLDFVDNLIVCRPQTNLALGSTHAVQVRNPDNKNSNTLNITIPSRVCKMEFDAIQNVPLPDYYVWQDNTVNTFRRIYTQCGWIIEFQLGGTEITDPHPGTAWTYPDLYSFWQADANIPSSGYYMHGLFIEDGPGPRGVMYMNTGSTPSLPAANYRQGFACFWDDFAVYTDKIQRYFRTSVHESGHGFNLLHGDQTGNQTLMTVTPSLVAGWHCFFSNTSCTHLRTHNINAVAPGGEAFGFSRSCNSLH